MIQAETHAAIATEVSSMREVALPLQTRRGAVLRTLLHGSGRHRPTAHAEQSRGRLVEGGSAGACEGVSEHGVLVVL